VSKLIYGLKEKNNLSQKITIYISKEYSDDYRILKIKKKIGLKDFREVLKFCISYQVFSLLDLNKELYEQLKYSINPGKFVDQIKEFADSTTITVLKEKYIKVEVLKWHLTVCLSKFKDDHTSFYHFINEVLDKSWDRLENINNNFNKELKVYKISVPRNFLDNISSLKLLHGNYKNNNLLKRCLEIYAYDTSSNHVLSVQKINFNNEKHNFKSTSDEVDLRIPIVLAESLNFKYDDINKIEKIINHNLLIFNNLFPERSINNGKIT